MMTKFGRRKGWILLTASALATVPATGSATSSVERQFHLPAQSLGDALRAVGRASGLDVMFPADAIAGRTAPALDGRFAPLDAIEHLLAGSGLSASISDGAVLIRGRDAAAPSDGPPTPDSTMILVTGTRIRGGHPMSPVTTVTQKEALEAGQTSIGSIIGALPENYAGGQNPGVAGAGGQGSANVNITSGATINLRGLGPDATLTLINGHRGVYNSLAQAVDVSQIPLAALDHIDVVADGASALYGSDAVGGVANIILKPDTDGLDASARVGGATRGGDLEQQYDLVGGHRWASGGFMLAGDLSHNSAIDASDRKQLTGIDGTTTLYPRISQRSLIFTGHQQLVPAIRFSIDGNYNHRSSVTNTANLADQPYPITGQRYAQADSAWSISPRLDITVGGGWAAWISSTYGVDRDHGGLSYFNDGSATSTNTTLYRNSLATVEAGGEGPLFRLPGGDVRLALGAGYRRYGLKTALGTITNATSVDLTAANTHQDVAYGFAEIYAPLVGPDSGVPAIQRLALDAAVRIESYPGIERIATPKLGFDYAPIADFDVKASWGKSFKAPTLQQQSEAVSANLLPIDYFASPSHGPDPVLFVVGGNPDLRPEKATSWSATLDVHPQRIPGLTLDFSYFNIAYRNRIILPLASLTGDLDNPLDAALVTLEPDAAAQTAAIALADSPLANQTGDPYDPAHVSAIVDDRYHNVQNQKIRGFDLGARYRAQIGRNRFLTVSGQASHLDSSQVTFSGGATAVLAGTIYHPPHWRARGGVAWETPSLSLTAYANYTGGVVDDRLAVATGVRGMTTVDLAATWRAPATSRIFGGTQVILSVSNVANAKPASVVSDDPTNPAFDSTNYSIIGRFVSLTLSRHF